MQLVEGSLTLDLPIGGIREAIEAESQEWIEMVAVEVFVRDETGEVARDGGAEKESTVDVGGVEHGGELGEAVGGDVG